MEDILKQRKVFAEAALSPRSEPSSSHNSFGGFILDDMSLRTIGTWVCHGWLIPYNLSTLCNKHKFQSKDIKYILSACMHSFASQDKVLAHIDWLVNRSPWASIFLDKDVARIYELGFVVDAHAPSNLVGNGLVATRFYTESYVSDWKNRAPINQEFLDMGFTETEAYLFTHLYAPDKKSLYPVTYSRYSSGHAVLSSSNVGKEYYKNFLSGNPVNLSGSIRECGGYPTDTLNATWGKSVSGDRFSERVQALRPIIAVQKKDLHIFRRTAREAWSYENREQLKSVLTQLKEMIYA